MISWIQSYFQKHFRTVFAVLLAVTIVSFVLTIGAAPGINNSGHEVLQQPFYGYNLGNEQQARRIFRDGQISAELQGNYQAAQRIQEFSLGRIAGLALADELHLPAATAAEVSAFVAGLPTFKDEQGNFSPTRYKQFEDSLKTSPDLTIADVNRIFRDDARLHALTQVLAGPGYVLPSDVTDYLKRSDATWTITTASRDYAGYDAGVQVNDVVLQKFYDENSFRYEVPARPRLSLVEFKAAEFTPAASPTEQEARAFYEANKPRFPAPTEAGKTDLANPPDDFAKVRAQVEQAMKDNVGLNLASKAANDLTVAIYERKVAANSAELAAVLAAHRRAATALQPFTFDAPPADRPWLARYADQINRLGKDRFFSDPLQTPDGFIVLLWNEALPGYKPMLAQVKDKVAADYTEGEKRQRFLEAGKTLRAKLQAAAKAGRFDDVAKAEQLELKSHANFSLRQRPQDLPYAAYGALQAFLDPGEVSEMVATGDKGVFTHVVDRQLPDLSTANPRYTEVSQLIAQNIAAANAASVISARVEAELKKNAPAKNATP